MKLPSHYYCLPLLLIAFAATGDVTFPTSTAKAQEGLPKVDLTGFERIFDGETHPLPEIFIAIDFRCIRHRAINWIAKDWHVRCPGECVDGVSSRQHQLHRL